MLPDLSEWTLDDVANVSLATVDESIEVEKKASAKFDLSDSPKKRETLDEIAKQACAFANAGGGFVVFGVKDAKEGGGIDGGVNRYVGREPVVSWLEKMLPAMTSPAIVNCRVRFIQYGT